MAKGKKSFVLYADLINCIEHLTTEEKGILLNHLLEYVNDKNPILENRVVLSAWKPIELQLKRDLKKFEEVKEKRSEAGKKSAQARSNKSKQKSTNSTSVKSVEHFSTNSTVNDNVNVNVINKKIISIDITKKEIFEEWLNYRKEIKKPIKNQTTLQALIKKFNSKDLDICKKVVNLSIENNYQGLIWNKFEGNNKEKSISKINNGRYNVI